MNIRAWVVCAGIVSLCRVGTADAAFPAPDPHESHRQRDTIPSGGDVSDVPEAFGDDTRSSEMSSLNESRYDTLQARSRRRFLPRLIADAILRSSRDTSGHRVVDENRLLEPYEGRIIRHITVGRRRVFESEGNAAKLRRFANSLHTLTREQVIRRDLLIKTGTPFEADAVVKNLQLLRSRRHIADAWIDVVPDPDDPTVVDLVVMTHDSWTLGADGSIAMDGRTTAELYDANMFGSGNLLKVGSSFDWRHGGFGGSRAEYGIPNFLGTFYEAYLIAGRRFERADLGARLEKRFILPQDYMLGGSYMRVSDPTYLIFLDSTYHTRRNSADLWAGYSHYFRKINSSLYLTGRYMNDRFRSRPDVGSRYNPAFHDMKRVLGGIGFYREHFYTANLVYGYGMREYLATGYRAELTAGYEWGEFEERRYFGAHYAVGGFSRGGAYLTGGLTFGSYFRPSTGTWHGSGIDVDLRYFSRLFTTGRMRIRQFVRTNYTNGWERYAGNDEVLTFTNERGPLGFRTHVIGTNRLNVNGETVYFTPWQPYGFQVALFHFVDLSLMGFSSNIFRNDFFSTVGIGIRVKNERLVFNAIQLRLGVALGKRGFMKSEYVRMSNQQRVEEYRFLPVAPEMLPFR